MKGLLLKDLYMMRKYCWMMLAVIVLFTAVSFVDKANMFFQFYPIVIISVLPVTSCFLEYGKTWP